MNIARPLFAFICILFAVSVALPACAADVTGDSTEPVGEAQEALTSCGLRGSCPTGYGCDFSDNLCHLLCATSGACDDRNVCTVDTCAHGLCYYSPLNCDDGIECTLDGCNPNVTGGCVHVNADSSHLCDGGTGHCNEGDTTCCHGVFLPASNICAPACPPGSCPDAVTAQCFYYPGC